MIQTVSWKQPSPFPTVRVFYCYTRQDKELRDELENHLCVLKRSGNIITWHDREIQAGVEWEKEIEARLESAHLILLLVSASFIASEYCWGEEMRRALERHLTGKAHVIPILLRPVYL